MPERKSIREATSAAGGEARSRGLYDEDFWMWSKQQAKALRNRDLDAIDWDNVIEEIDSLGRDQESFWTSDCAKVIANLLKIEHTEARESCRLRAREILKWRNDMHFRLTRRRGMAAILPEMLENAWWKGRRNLITELSHEGDPPYSIAKERQRDLDFRLPQECPYSLVEVAGYDPHDEEGEPDWEGWPDGVARALDD